jgi:hypothetical protein
LQENNARSGNAEERSTRLRACVGGGLGAVNSQRLRAVPLRGFVRSERRQWT